MPQAARKKSTRGKALAPASSPAAASVPVDAAWRPRAHSLPVVWQQNMDKNEALRLLDQGLVQIQTTQLLEFLSEFLVIERGAADLYELAEERAATTEIADALQDYRDQVEHHCDLIESMIRELGGDPSEMSAPAQLYRDRTRALLGLSPPTNYREIADLDNLLVVLTKIHSNWAFLRSVIPHLDDPRARELGEELLSEINDEEEEQLDWVRQTLGRSLMQRAASS